MNEDIRIIIEGSDGTGKTTIAKELAELYNLSYVHLTNNDPKDVDFYYQLLRKKNIVADRHFISEWIYPGVFDREPEIDFSSLEKLIGAVEKEKIVVVILTANLNDIKLRIEPKDEYQEVKNNLEWINRQFVEFALVHGMSIFNTSLYSIDELVSKIDCIIQKKYE